MIGPELALGVVAVLLAVSLLAAVVLAGIFQRAEQDYLTRKEAPVTLDTSRGLTHRGDVGEHHES